MKKIILFSFLLFISMTSFGQLKNLKPGSVLTYGVKAQGKEYDFIVTLKTFNSSSAVEFDWKMTSPVDKSGSIRIPGIPMISSYAWNNFFSDGANTLHEETSVVISEMLRNELKAATKGTVISKPLKINGISQPGEKFTVVNTEEAHFYREKGEMVMLENCIKISNDMNDKFVIISNEPTFGLILNMSIGFQIQLKSIQF